MSSKRTVLFIDGSAYLLEGFRETRNHVRGRVVNGFWDMYIVKHDELCWIVYSAQNRNQCVGANELTKFNPANASWIEVPETMFGDYNVIINWARARKEEANGTNNGD